MSDYFQDPYTHAPWASDEATFDPRLLDYPAPIGEQDFAGFDFDAGTGPDLDSGYDFDTLFESGDEVLPPAQPVLGSLLGPDPGFASLDGNAGFGLDTPATFAPLQPDVNALPDQSVGAEYVAGDIAGSLMHRQLAAQEQAGGSTDTDDFTSGVDVDMITAPNEIRSSSPLKERSYVCLVCQEGFDYDYQLEWHCEHYLHASLVCHYPGCGKRFITRIQLRTHKQTPHVPGHHLTTNPDLTFDLRCSDCGQTFLTQNQVQLHANSTKHTPFECSCGKRYARIDVARRHINKFNKEGERYPCTYCKRHRGKQGFLRRDHLVQHLQGYHKLDHEKINEICPPARSVASRQILTCPHEDCEDYRDEQFRSLPWKTQEEQRPFQKHSDFNRHMRDVHQQSAFPCRIAGCDRTGRKGYMREKDLLKHVARDHPGAPSYIPQVTESQKFRCHECGKGLGTAQTLRSHLTYACGRRFW